MVNNEIPVRIPEDLYTSQEQFVTIAPDIEFGDQGTIRLQSYSFLDGEAVYLNLQGTEVRREAGFQKPLTLTKSNQESRSYVFRIGQWYQQTTAPNSTMTSLQRHVGQYGLWVGFHNWCVEVGEIIAGLILYCITPFVVIPALTVRAVEFLFGAFMLAIFCFAFWQMVFEVVALFLFGKPTSS